MSRRPGSWLPSGVVLDEGRDLGGSERSQVHRHPVLQGPPGWGRSVVVKRFLPRPVGSRAALGYRRELVGLAHLPGAPALLAHDDASQSLVLEDLGTHPTLADVLLGTDPAAARRHSVRWAETLGRTVRTDPQLLADVRGQLGPALGEDQEARSEFPRRGLLRLEEVGAVRHGRAARAEIRDAVDWLERDRHHHVLGPGDACPDNAVLAPGGVRFLDLEGTGVRHAAYEAAYAAEPFSTCWCVFSPPADLPDLMLGAFTRALAGQLPGLEQDADWPAQVRVAVAAWVLSGTLWLLEGALADRSLTAGGDPARGPRFRALLLSRWRWVARECAQSLPQVAAACQEAQAWALRAWASGSSLALPPYPAWGQTEPSGPPVRQGG